MPMLTSKKEHEKFFFILQQGFNDGILSWDSHPFSHIKNVRLDHEVYPYVEDKAFMYSMKLNNFMFDIINEFATKSPEVKNIDQMFIVKRDHNIETIKSIESRFILVYFPQTNEIEQYSNHDFKELDLDHFSIHEYLVLLPFN